MTDPTLTAPWTNTLITRLNLSQTGTGDDWAMHPYTCEHRGDGRHGNEGGDLGVLIATAEGWVCPHCAYRQAWAHALPNEIRPVAMIGPDGLEVLATPRRVLLDRLNRMIPAYEALADAGATGAETMLAVLFERRTVLQAPPPDASLWVIYARPSDYPEEFVARRFNLRTQRPTHELRRGATLDAVRALLPPDATRIPRQRGEDPVIVESWWIEAPAAAPSAPGTEG